MAQFRVEQVASPSAFLDDAAARGWDDSSMNFVLGMLADSYIPAKVAARQLTDAQRTAYAVYRGDELVLAISKVAGDFAWTLGTPRSADLSPEDLAAASAQLALAIVPGLEPAAMNGLFGQDALVDAFVDAWVSALRARGVSVSASGRLFDAKAAYATLATLPPASTPHPAYTIEPATAADVDALAPLFAEFSQLHHRPLSVDAARERVAGHVACGEAWVCRARADGALAAFCVTGRATRRTVAIRNVFVDHAHRRRGVASALTAGMLRFFLGAHPHGVDAPAAPEGGAKAEVCLNVGEDHVERIYARCGFRFGEDAETGKKEWFRVIIREFEVQGPGQS